MYCMINSVKEKKNGNTVHKECNNNIGMTYRGWTLVRTFNLDYKEGPLQQHVCTYVDLL